MASMYLLCIAGTGLEADAITCRNCAAPSSPGGGERTCLARLLAMVDSWWWIFMSMVLSLGAKGTLAVSRSLRVRPRTSHHLHPTLEKATTTSLVTEASLPPPSLPLHTSDPTPHHHSQPSTHRLPFTLITPPKPFNKAAARAFEIEQLFDYPHGHVRSTRPTP